MPGAVCWIMPRKIERAGDTSVSPALCEGSFGSGRRLEDGLDVDREVDGVAEHDNAVVDAAEADAEVVAVDLGVGGEAGARAPETVRPEAVELEAQRDLPGDAAQGELAVDEEVAVRGDHARRAVGGGGVGLGVEEVARADVVVTALVVGVDGRDLDRGGDRRVGRVRAGDQFTFEIAKMAPDLADHHVAHGEGDVRVNLIDGPAAGDVPGGCD